MRTRRLSFVVGLVLLSAEAMAQESVRIPWGSDTLAAEARAVAPGQRLVIDALSPASGGTELVLELERVEAFAPGARIVVHGEDGVSRRRPPADVRLRGRVLGEASSRAVVSVLEDGTVRGVVSAADGYRILGGATRAANGAPPRKAVAPPEEAGFRCDNGGLEPPPDSTTPAPLAVKATSTPHTAVVAIETDYELYFDFGGDVDAMASYIGDLVAFASGIYDDELATNLVIGDLFVWSSSNDPWQESGGGCALLELGKYWHENRTGVERTLTHFLSGKNGGSGIAWVGVLCRNDFNTSQQNAGASCPNLPQTGVMGGAYGFTKGITGSFDPQAANVVWDIVAFAHEVGHNFDSPHTHCYEGIGGISNAVDECYALQNGPTCYFNENNVVSLPANCPGAGQHRGTIMSYCHLRSPGMSNLALSFGRELAYGVLPDRVPARMRSHVEANAGCMPRIDPEVVFVDDFESGSMSRWSAP